MMRYANEYGASCGTGRLAASAILALLVPLVLVVGGLGWWLAAFVKKFSKIARLGFICAALTSIYFFVFVHTLLRDLVSAFL